MSTPRRQWTLRNRLRTGLIVSAASLGLVLIVALAAFAQLSRHQDEVTGVVFDAVVELEELQADLTDADSAVRAFALTGDEDLLVPYLELERGRPDKVRDGLGWVLPRVPGLDEQFDVLADATDLWRAEYAEPIIVQTRTDGPGPSVAELQERGIGYFSALRSQLRLALDGLLDYRAERADAMVVWQGILIGTVIAIAVAALAVGAGLWWYLRRWITGPMRELATVSRAVAEGDLEREVAVDGPEEVVELAEDVDLMRRRLVAQIGTIETARAELEASNRDLEQFAYVASHDLQEPLRKVASFTQLLQRRYGGQLDERADQYIEFAADGAKRMQRLIQDLLAFSRLGRGGQEAEVVALDRCLTGALRNLSDTIEESGATVTAEPLPEVLGHEGILTQLLQNLIGNAVKFRAPDVAPHVRIGVRKVGGEWLFHCADNGIGIEPRHAERVFAIFQRLHAKDAYSGTGIGLAMCKRIVEQHGGRIWVEPREPDDGAGTTLRWTLPTLDAARLSLAQDEAEERLAETDTPGRRR